MTFVDRKAHRPTFIASIDGFPFHLVEEKQPIFLTVAISGDLNSGGEYMRCFVNDTQLGGNLATGFQDGTLRNVIENEDVTNLLGENPVVKLAGFGSTGVNPLAGLTNDMRFTFTDAVGQDHVFTLNNVQLGATVTENHPIPVQSISLLDQSIQLGGERLDLDTMATTGSSGTLEIRSTPAIKPYFEKLTPSNFFQQTASINDSDTTANLNTTATSFLNKIAFVGGETVFISNAVGTTITMQRGVLSSNAEGHFGGAQSGERYTEFVQGWSGRSLRLYVKYKDNEGAFPSLATQLLRMRIDDAPQYRSKDFFTIPVTDYAALFIDKKIYVNMTTVPGSALPSSLESGRLNISGEQAEQLEKQNFNTLAWCKVKAVWGSRENTSNREFEILCPYTYNTTSITVAYEYDQIGSADLSDAMSADNVAMYLVSAKQVVPVSTNPVISVWAILNSGSSSGTYANAFQSSSAVTAFFDSVWRIGAAISDSFLDEASLLKIQNRANDLPWSWCLNKEMTVGSLLSWLCQTTRSFWYVDPTGKITFDKFDLKYTANSQSVAATIDSSNLLLTTTDSFQLTEKNIAGSYKVKTNYDWSGKSQLEINMADYQTRKIYPEAEGVISFDMPFIVVDEPTALDNAMILGGYNPISRFQLETHIRRRMKMNASGMLTAEAECGWSLISVKVGDYVNFDNEAGFQYGAPSLRWLVIGKRVNYYGGTITLSLVGIKAGRRIGVSGAVASWASIPKYISFTSTDPEWNGNDPSSYFEAGEIVAIHDTSTGALEEREVISIVNATTIEIDSAPSFTPTAGDLVLSSDYDDSTLTKKENDLWQVDRGVLGSGNREGSRFN